MNATKITKRERINDVMISWKEHYFRENKWYDKSKEDIYLELKDVFNNNPKPKAKVIDEIIGNDSWTSMHCDVCDKSKNTLYYFRPYYYDEYENSGLRICKKCLKK